MKNHSASVAILCLAAAAPVLNPTIGRLAGQGRPPLIARVPNWSVAAKPRLLIGNEDAPETQFTYASVRILPQGDIAVADLPSNEIRIFRADGSFVRRLSRTGAGPGEIEGAFVLARNGDTLFALQGAPGPTLTHAFAIGRGFLGRRPLRAIGATRPTPIDRTSDGNTVVLLGAVRVLNEVPPIGTVFRDTLTIALIPATGGQARVLGTFPAATLVAYGLPAPSRVVLVGALSIGPALVIGVSGDRVWIGDSGTGNVSIFDGSGRMVHSVRFPAPQRRLSEAALGHAREAALRSATTERERARIAATYDPAVRPRNAPFFSRFVGGPGGEIWIVGFEEDPGVGPEALVMDWNGRPIARVGLPARFTLQDVGETWIAGVSLSENGTERIALFDLKR
jgi:hypothetical protein